MKRFLYIVTAIIVVGFIMASDLSVLKLLRITPSKVSTDNSETDQSPWVYREVIDPLTDNPIQMAVGRFDSENGFVAGVQMSCETGHNGAEVFRLETSFYDLDTLKPRRLKTTLSGYTEYQLRFGSRPSVCIKAGPKYILHANSLHINFGESKTGIEDLRDFVLSDNWATILSGKSDPGSKSCNYQLHDPESEIREWKAAADMVLKVSLDLGEATFLIDTAHEQAWRVMRSCERALSVEEEVIE